MFRQHLIDIEPTKPSPHLLDGNIIIAVVVAVVNGYTLLLALHIWLRLLRLDDGFVFLVWIRHDSSGIGSSSDLLDCSIIASNLLVLCGSRLDGFVRLF